VKMAGQCQALRYGQKRVGGEFYFKVHHAEPDGTPHGASGS